MKLLRIVNQGLIDPQALSLLGASTKRGDEAKIGMFGSGNKYALAYFLRNGSVEVYSGTKKVPIEVRTEIFREKEFGVVYINNERTSITTEFGMEWKFWQATREIYSNALDEGGATIALVDKMNPKEGETHFYIATNQDDIQSFVEEFDMYFNDKRKPLFSNHIGTIYEKSVSKNLVLYRKGIRCYDSPKRSIFDYNIDNIRINESRTIAYWWEVDEKVWSLIFSCTNEIMIERLLRNIFDGDLYEGEIGSIATLPNNHSEEFVKVVQRLRLCPRSFYTLLPEEEKETYIFIPNKLFDNLLPYVHEDNLPRGMRTSKDGKSYKEFEMDALQNMTIKKALEFFRETGLSIPYDVKVAVFENKKIFGIAEPKTTTIFISDLCISKGVNEVVNTIIEEYIHLKYGCSDETRAFQTAAITEFVDYMKRKSAYAL